MRWTVGPIILNPFKINFWKYFIHKIIVIVIMNKFITIGNEKVSITEIENAKTIPELLQTRVQYAI